jgi:cytochrome c2
MLLIKRTALFLLLIILNLSCQEKQAPITAPTPVEDISYNIRLKDFLNNNFQKDSFMVQSDPVLGKGYTTQGISIRSIMDSMILKGGIDREKMPDYSMVFVCNDGYMPYTPLDLLYEQDGFLLKVEDASDVFDTEALQKKYGPYYLVWPKITSAELYPWPYAVVELTIKNSLELYGAAYPKEDARAQEGFKVFKARCLKCHSVNKIGGVMGPELNYPRNILEYWEEDHIYAFVNNPQSYRYNSKMAPIKLVEEDFEQILTYLKYMKQHKIIEED